MFTFAPCQSQSRVPLATTLMLSTLFAFVGCQQASDNLTGGTSPDLSPAVPQQSLVEDDFATPLGIWRLTGDLASQEISLMPFERQSSALGDSFTVDVTSLAGRFLRIDSISRPTGSQFSVTFRFTHPFTDPAVRSDLHLFDVRLHAIGPAAVNTFSGADGLTTLTGAGGAAEPLRQADIAALNADGWSSWGDEVVEPVVGNRTPNLYPYWSVNEAPTEPVFDDANPAGWNVLPMSSTQYLIPTEFDFAGLTKIDLLVALEASYGQSAQGPLVTPLADPGGRKNPLYFLPQFSLKEAWKTTVSQTGDLTIGAASTKVDFELAIYDHQGNRAAVGAFDPLTAPQSSLRYSSNLASVSLAVPQLLGLAISKDGATFTGSGSPTDPYRGTISLHGDQVSGTAGTYPGLLAIRDAHPPSTMTLSPLGTLGVDRNLAPVERHDYAMYLPVSITATVSANQAPTAVINANPTTVANGGTTSLSPGAGTTDPDGSITLYEYDFDYVGGNFTVDTSNTTGTAVTSPALTGPASRTMAMRVTDNGTPALSAIDSVVITVEAPPNTAPTADLAANPTTVANGGTTSLSPGPGTGDPDGSIILWEYDFDYVGTTFTVDASKSTNAAVTSPALTVAGSRTMAMRVTDNGTPGLKAIDTVVITVQAPVNQPPTANLSATPATIESGQTVQCAPGAGTGDPDGSITLYEYDFDYVGTTFTVDASNSNGATVVSPAITNTGASPIQRTMALRVTDNGTPGLKTVDTAIVTINPAPSAPTWTQVHTLMRTSVNGGDSCKSCHSGGGEGGLVITNDPLVSYNNMLNKQADCGLDLIVPFDSAGSFVYEKVNSGNPQCGDPMPPDTPRWDAASIKMLKDWIDAGALNN